MSDKTNDEEKKNNKNLINDQKDSNEKENMYGTPAKDEKNMRNSGNAQIDNMKLANRTESSPISFFGSRLFNNPIAIYEQANSLYEKGNYRDSLKFYKKALMLFKEFLDPDQNIVLFLYERIGDIYKNLGNFKIAVDYYQNLTDAIEKIHRKEPASEQYARSLALGYLKIAQAFEKLKDIQTSLTYYQRIVEIYEKLLHKNFNSTEYARDLATIYDRLGEIYQAMDDVHNATENYQHSLEIREKLYLKNPQSDQFARELMISYYKLQRWENVIEILLYMKSENMNIDESLQDLLNKLTLNVPDFFEEMGRYYHNQAWQLFNNGNKRKAIEFMKKSVVTFQQLYETWSIERNKELFIISATDLVSALGTLGIWERNGNLIEQGIQIAEQTLQKFSPREENLSYTWGILMSNLGDLLFRKGELIGNPDLIQQGIEMLQTAIAHLQDLEKTYAVKVTENIRIEATAVLSKLRGN